jgi:hypothetical protein
MGGPINVPRALRGDLEAADFHDLLEPINDEDVVVLVNDDLVSRLDPSKITPSQPLVYKGA